MPRKSLCNRLFLYCYITVWIVHKVNGVLKLFFVSFFFVSLFVVVVLGGIWCRLIEKALDKISEVKKEIGERQGMLATICTTAHLLLMAMFA